MDSSLGWLLKWNTDASTIESKHFSTSSLVCRDKLGWVQYYKGEAIGDYKILVTETLAIREAVLTIIEKRLSSVVIEGDSEIVIRVIMGDITLLLRFQMLSKILCFSKAVWNTKLIYCNKFTNKLDIC